MKKVKLHDKTFRRTILYRDIVRKIKVLAEEINRRHAGAPQPPVFVSVLNGAFMFTAELLKHIDFPCETVFVRLSSYWGTESSGDVRQVIGLDRQAVHGRQVIVLEDIVETGRTVEVVRRLLEELEPDRMTFAALFFKPQAYANSFPIDLYAMELPNDFIIGFGLDYNQLGRNLPDVYTLMVRE
jgi:hypoxanthine phosphoribosyltransferase